MTPIRRPLPPHSTCHPEEAPRRRISFLKQTPSLLHYPPSAHMSLRAQRSGVEESRCRNHPLMLHPLVPAETGTNTPPTPHANRSDLPFPCPRECGGTLFLPPSTTIPRRGGSRTALPLFTLQPKCHSEEAPRRRISPPLDGIPFSPLHPSPSIGEGLACPESSEGMGVLPYSLMPPHHEPPPRITIALLH